MNGTLTRKRSTLTAVLIGAVGMASAQVAFEGSPWSLELSGETRTSVPVATMPAVDRDQLLAEDEARAATGNKMLRFGSVHPTDLSTENSGEWLTLPGGDRIWRIGLHCPEAYTVNFEFHDYVVPSGGKVYVYNEEGATLGAFTAESSNGLKEMGVMYLNGDRITVEYNEPASVAGQGRLRIGQVTHGYRDLSSATKGFNTSGSCNNNVICPVANGWRDEIRSVAMMMSGGSGFCTGTLINNCAEDGTPYFLTAQHCLGGSMNNWLFAFNWDSPNCTPNTNIANNRTVTGATLMGQLGSTDMALLRLNSTPPASYNVFYSGWNIGTTAPTSMVGIHHPDGDQKKISFDNDPGTNAQFQGVTSWRVTSWDDGTTEPGSSGSGLWDQNRRLIGQLYGGYAACSNNLSDYYGRLSVSHSTISQWLGNCGNTLDGYDPATSSVNDLSAGARLSLVPNPSQGAVRIDVPEGFQGAAEVMVFDATGRLAWRKPVTTSDRLDLDLSSLGQGIYSVALVGRNSTATGRLVLTH